MKYALSIAALSALLAGKRRSAADAVSVGASTDLGTPTLEITVNGAAETVPNNQYAYFSRGANDQDRLQWTMTLDGSGKAELVGNMWKALKVAPHDVVYNTVLEFDVRVEDPAEFQAICLDDDLISQDPGFDCLTFAGYELGQRRGMDVRPGATRNNIDQLNGADINNVTFTNMKFPIGRYMMLDEAEVYSVEYLAFIQDQDVDRSAGSSTFDNIKIYEDNSSLSISIDGASVELGTYQNGYKSQDSKKRSPSKQDQDGHLMSFDGSSVTLVGNHWKAISMPEHLLTASSVLEFDVSVEEEAEFHSICLDNDLVHWKYDKHCFTFAGRASGQNRGVNLRPDYDIGAVSETISIPIGHYLKLGDGETYSVTYLAFIQDEDSGDKQTGRSTLSNIKIYEDPARVPLKVQLYGATVNLPVSQFSMASANGHWQDTIEHLMEVSADGSTVEMDGNAWKYLEFPEVFNVTGPTVLKFTFTLTEEAEGHTICLLPPGDHRSNTLRKDCFNIAGKDVSASSREPYMTETEVEGELVYEYEVLVGQKFIGQVGGLGFSQDNDGIYTNGDKDIGTSSYSNIQIYNLPDVIVSLDGADLAVPNFQHSYESTNQDNRPFGKVPNLVDVSADGRTLTLNGNIWRYFPLAEPIDADSLGDFVVSFDYTPIEFGQHHAICFEDNERIGDHDDPSRNLLDPKRCMMLNDNEDVSNEIYIYGFQPQLKETHRYAISLGSVFNRFDEWKNLVVIQDNDDDKSVGKMTISNIRVVTDLKSCLKDKDFTFEFDAANDCTMDNFLAKVGDLMDLHSSDCAGQDDPLLEMLAFYGLKTEVDVSRKIEMICRNAFERDEYDFYKVLSSDSKHFVPEFLDGGTDWNYLLDLPDTAERILMADELVSNHRLAWPEEHHAFDNCEVGAGMCCWVDQREGYDDQAANADVCYVDMKASRHSAHVKNGYSIYQGDTQAYCKAWAWKPTGGTVSGAHRGNALFKTAFIDGLQGSGSVEQLPGAPLCGCMDRMPVVTAADCVKVTDAGGKVVVSHEPSQGKAYINAAYIEGSGITIDNSCNFLSEFEALNGDDAHLMHFVNSRVVGDGKCSEATANFLDTKGLKIGTTAIA